LLSLRHIPSVIQRNDVSRPKNNGLNGGPTDHKISATGDFFWKSLSRPPSAITLIVQMSGIKQGAISERTPTVIDLSLADTKTLPPIRQFGLKG
jgi:hypothetical protein